MKYKTLHSLILISLLLSNFITESIYSQNNKPFELNLTVPMGHSDEVTTVAYSHNNKYLVSGSNDEPLIIWECATGRQIKSFYGQPLRINALQFTKDDKFFISAGNNKTIILWNAFTGEQIRTFTGHKAEITQVFLNLDDNKIISSSLDSTIKIWDLNSGKVIKTIQYENSIFSMALCNDNKTLAISDYSQKVSLINFETGKIKKIIENGDKYRFIMSGKNTCLIFSEDNKYLFSANDTLKQWNVKTGKLEKFYTEFNGRIRSISQEKNSKILYFSVADKVIKWNYETGTIISTFSDAQFKINSLAISSDFKNFATAGGNGEFGINELLIWNNSGKIIQTLKGYTYNINSAQITSDNKYIISSGGLWYKSGKLNCWNIKNPKLNKTYSRVEEHFDYFDLGKNKNLLLSAFGKQVQLRDISKDSLIRSFNFENLINSLAYSSDNKYFAVIDNTNSAKIYELESAKIINTIESDVSLAKFSPINSNLILTAESNGELKLWEISTNKVIKTYVGLSDYITCADFSPDGKYIVAGGIEKKICLWETETGKLIHVFKGHSNIINCMRFSENGNYMISCSGVRYNVKQSSGEIILWDLKSLKPLKTFNGHYAAITSACFIMNDKYILSSSWDNTMKIWSVETGNEIAMLVPFGENDWTIVTPNGFFDSSPGAMSKMYFTKELEIIPLESFFEKYYKPNLLNSLLEGETFSPIDFGKNDILLPPKITIIPQKDNIIPISENFFSTQQQKIKFTVNIETKDIDELRFYSNGKLISTETSNFQKSKENIFSKQFNVSLSNGSNVLKLIAINKQRTESVPAEISINYSSSDKSFEIEPTCNLYIFAIGINKYKNSHYNLTYCLPDATAFVDTLKKGSSSIFEQTFTYFLSDNSAVKDSIVSKFNNIKSKAKTQDVFIFYYAGHGVMSQDSIPDFYLIPSDITSLYADENILQQKGISASYLRDISKEIKAQKQLFILDACQSGGAVDAFVSRGATEEKAITQLARSAGIILLSASAGDQFASEFKEIGHGVFTFSILEGLQGKADGSIIDKKITVNELKSYIDQRVPELTEKYGGQAQYPQCIMKGMDFPIVIVK